MKIFTLTFALLSMLLLTLSSGPVTAHASAPHFLPAGTWQSVYTDDFSSASSLPHYNDCYKWACAGGWNGELERYTTSSISTTHSNLDLQATKCNVTAHGISYSYCSGMVTTANKFSFLYGYAEARVLLPAGQGLWPAFWMLAENGQSTTELDVMEVLGNDPSTINVGSHWLVNGQHKHHGAAVKGANLASGYHTVAVDWEPSSMTFYEDGKAIWSTTDRAAIPATPMYLILNLAVGGNWPGKPNSSTPFPSNFLIDWVHVYQHASGVLPTPTVSVPTATPTIPTPLPITPTATPKGCDA